MNPLEWIATLLWDISGKRREEQQHRLARTRRTIHRYERVNERAIQQIRRVQRVASGLADRRR